MPYVAQDRRIVAKDVYKCSNPGELNYLITLILIKLFKERPKYETLHILRREFVIEPKKNEFLQKLRSDFAHIFTVGDIYAAAQEAYHEFRIRVGDAYEKKKMRENGDLPEYVEMLKEIEGEPSSGPNLPV